MSQNRKRGDIPAILDTPESIARAIMQGPPKDDWRYPRREREPDGGDEE